MNATSHLVFDIETYPDKKLIEHVHGKDVQEFRAELARQTGSDFLPTIFHIPIAIAVLLTDAEFGTLRIEVRTAPPEQERELLEYFWATSNEIAASSGGTLVSFNGSDFDLRVLEQRALRYALRCNTAFRGLDHHFDIPLFLANFQPARKRGLTLNALSKHLGLAGKPILEGSQVQSAFERGDLQQIGQYCLLDVVQTYLIFLRCQVLLGLQHSLYERAVEAISTYIAESSDPCVRGVGLHIGEAVQAVKKVFVGS